MEERFSVSVVKIKRLESCRIVKTGCFFFAFSMFHLLQKVFSCFEMTLY